MRLATVAQLCDPDRPQSVVVRDSEPLEEVLRRFGQEIAPRSIFVEDAEGHLVGVITRHDILDWIRLRIGTALRGPEITSDRILRLAQLVRASTARDAIHPDSLKAAIRLQDTLDEALRKMLAIDLIALPVVDDAGKIVGEVAISNVLRTLLNEGNAGDDTQSC